MVLLGCVKNLNINPSLVQHSGTLCFPDMLAHPSHKIHPTLSFFHTQNSNIPRLQLPHVTEQRLLSYFRDPHVALCCRKATATRQSKNCSDGAAPQVVILRLPAAALLSHLTTSTSIRIHVQPDHSSNLSHPIGHNIILCYSKKYSQLQSSNEQCVTHQAAACLKCVR
uniref:Uncharacterized protein TCIL3000_11_14510 n=1 Tax=Trypanosoma congolense (strain IL3000) TaxID=1068625 RepID=G0V2R2_TRYCI|nr:unnamed protein product [Trypanosoma congolense IL3000]